MTQVDDLSVGDWVAMFTDFVQTDSDSFMRLDHGFYGKPCQIVAISLPFVACHTIKGRLVTFDVRGTDLIKVNSAYVTAWKKSLLGQNRRPRTKKKLCPRCKKSPCQCPETIGNGAKL